VFDDTNWSDWTYALAVRAVTGDDIDLRALSRAQWFLFDPSSVDRPGGNDEVGYQALDIQYYGATINHRAIGDFEGGVDQLDAVTGDLLAGARGAADVSSLARLRDKVAALESFLGDTGRDFRTWARQLDSGGTDLSGTAAGVIQVRLARYAGQLELWWDRLKVGPTLLLSTAVENARTDLDAFRVGMVTAWQNEASAGLRGRIRAAVDAETAAIHDYLVSAGLVAGTPAYTLDKSDPTKQPNLVVTPTMIQDYHDRSRARILSVLAGYPKGDLRQPETWARINQSVSDAVSASLNDLDAAAPRYIEPLHGSYTTLGIGLKPLGSTARPAAGPPPGPSASDNAGSPPPGSPPPGGPGRIAGLRGPGVDALGQAARPGTGTAWLPWQRVDERPVRAAEPDRAEFLQVTRQRGLGDPDPAVSQPVGELILRAHRSLLQDAGDLGLPGGLGGRAHLAHAGLAGSAGRPGGAG